MPKKSPFNPDASYEEIRTQKLTKERNVRSIVNTSASDGVMSLKREDDPIVIAECIKREEALPEPRTSLLKPLKAKLKKLQPQTALDIKVDEIKAPDLWQPARDYYSAAQRFAKASVACQVMLGFELVNLKKKLGYVQGGKRNKQKAHDALFASFEEHVKAEIGISKDTARRFITMSEAVKARLKSCYKNLPLLEKPITDYSDEQLNLLDKAVQKCTDGETQKSLLIEWKIAKKPIGSEAKGGDLKGDDDDAEEEPTMRQLSFALFTDPVHTLSQLRANTDYQQALLALSIEQTEDEPVSLISMKTELEAMLADIEAAIKSNREATSKEAS